MSSRDEIKRVLDQAYEARRRQDLDAVIDCLHPNACFKVNGSDSPAVDRQGHQASIGRLFEAFDLLEFHPPLPGDRPAAGSRPLAGKFRAKRSGEVADTDILDLFEIKDGRIANMSTFFDTALAGRMLGG